MPTPKFSLLQPGDIIEAEDEYYNPADDRWEPVESHWVGYEYDPEATKPVRRAN